MALTVDVAIIGAGLGGLSTAYYLKKLRPDLDIIILEASHRIGGRTLSVEMKVSNGKTARFESGGQWIGPLHTDILELLKEFQLHDQLYSQYLDGKKVCWLEKGKISTYSLDLPFLNPFIYLEAFLFMRKIDKYGENLDCDNPFVSNPELAEYLDSMTCESLIRTNIHGSRLREIIRIAIRTTFGFETTQISALYVVLYAKSSGNVEALFSANNNGAQKLKLAGGISQISDRLLEMIGKDNVYFSSPVILANQTSDGVIVHYLKDRMEKVVNAKKVVFAVAPNQLMKISFEPSLPPRTVETLRALPMANLFKYTITYEKAFWRENNLSGETVCYGGDPSLYNDRDCPVGPVSVTYDACLPDGTPAIVGFSSGHETVFWSKYSVEERKQGILKTLAKMLGPEAMNPIDYHEHNWANDEYVGGCPVACLQPGVGRFFTSAIRLPFQNIHFAGTETAQRAIGYMSGAVQSGKRAAVEVVHSIFGEVDETYNDAFEMSAYGRAGKKSRLEGRWANVNDSVYSEGGRILCIGIAALSAVLIYSYINY